VTFDYEEYVDSRLAPAPGSGLNVLSVFILPRTSDSGTGVIENSPSLPGKPSGPSESREAFECSL
jgi:hypothetical protein